MKRFFEMTETEKNEYRNNKINKYFNEFIGNDLTNNYEQLMWAFPTETIKICKEMGLNGEQTTKKLGDMLINSKKFSKDVVDEYMMTVFRQNFEKEFAIKFPKEYEDYLFECEHC